MIDKERGRLTFASDGDEPLELETIRCHLQAVQDTLDYLIERPSGLNVYIIGRIASSQGMISELIANTNRLIRKEKE